MQCEFLKILSTDSEWCEAFVQGTEKAIVHKLLEIEGFHVERSPIIPSSSSELCSSLIMINLWNLLSCYENMSVHLILRTHLMPPKKSCSSCKWLYAFAYPIEESIYFKCRLSVTGTICRPRNYLPRYRRRFEWNAIRWPCTGFFIFSSHYNTRFSSSGIKNSLEMGSWSIASWLHCTIQTL